MIQVSSNEAVFTYESPEELLEKIEKDFEPYSEKYECFENIPLKSLIINDYDYKKAMQIDTVGEVWEWYWTRRR